MKAFAFLVLVACELQPPPPAPVAPLAAGSGSAVAVAEPPPAPPVDAAPPPDAMTVTQECLATGSHIADVVIAGASDPSLKASYEQARDRIVRSTAEACTNQVWTADAQRCFGLAKQKPDLEACEKKFPAPPPKR